MVSKRRIEDRSRASLQVSRSSLRRSPSRAVSAISAYASRLHEPPASSAARKRWEYGVASARGAIIVSRPSVFITSLRFIYAERYATIVLAIGSCADVSAPSSLHYRLNIGGGYLVKDSRRLLQISYTACGSSCRVLGAQEET